MPLRLANLIAVRGVVVEIDLDVVEFADPQHDKDVAAGWDHRRDSQVIEPITGFEFGKLVVVCAPGIRTFIHLILSR